MENQFCCVDSPVKDVFDEISAEEVEIMSKKFKEFEKKDPLINKNQS